MSKIVVWNIEKATHNGPKEDYTKQPVDICYSEEDARTKLKYSIAAHCEQFDDPVIDDSHPDDVLVYNTPTSKYPYTEFWLYSAVVQEA